MTTVRAGRRFRPMHRLPLASASAIAVAACLAWAGGAAAAEPAPVILSGIVVDDGSPAGGVELTVTPKDLTTYWVVKGRSGADGSFAVEVPASPGATVTIRGLGARVETPPDASGCWEGTSPAGHVEVSVDSEAPAPVTLDLDQELVYIMCPPATGTPQPQPAVTPPPTDAGARPGRGTTPALLPLAGIVLAASGGLLAVARRRAGASGRAAGATASCWGGRAHRPRG